MSVDPDELDKMHASAEAEEAYELDEGEDDEITVVDSLRAASAMLKKDAILFEFLANPDFCKSLTKRERALMCKQADRIYDFAETVDDALEELEEI